MRLKKKGSWIYGAGFTLLELVIVIIILGILATLGITQYTKMVEKGRSAEAKMVLGQIRSAEETYKLENGSYTGTIGNLAVEAPTACTSTHYFSYSISGGGAAFTATATRCTAGGKNPQATLAYIITLDQNAIWSGTAGYF